ncbi:hypothetical protein JKF63_00700 [Porcisia hertigi]|uniref:Uncharacterized protein n=1 Tax=Porcisia hertigi TaxID=2761500 RepID=A0A836L1A5_9TRYP|nr:hypothetical protein JKF63_00700 [Porcisia hertigi]
MSEDSFKALLSTLAKKGEKHVRFSGMEISDPQFRLIVTAMDQTRPGPQTIDVSNNKITSASIECLVSFLATASVESVDLHKNQIDEDGARAFFSLFETATSIKNLDLRHNTCSPATALRLYYLGRSDLYTPDVRSALLYGKASHISFAGMNYTDLGREFLECVLSTQGLQSIDFSGVSLGTGGMSLIGTLLRNTQVSALSFRNCDLSNDAVLAFIEAGDVVNDHHLSSLDFSSNMGLRDDLVRKLISHLFDKNDNIVNLELSGTSIASTYLSLVEKECKMNQEHPAIKRAAIALRNNLPASEKIILQWDAPLPTCMDYLAGCIANSSVIQHLNISNTLIDDAALQLLSDALRKNTSLRVIELANCRVTAIGIQALFAVLQKPTCSVQEVNIANNNLGEDSVEFITAALRSNPNLVMLNVDVNPAISSASMQEIAGLVMVNRAPPRIRSLLPSIESNSKNLESLDFSGRDVAVNDDCVWLLVQALQTNSTVRRLDFSHNCFGDGGVSYLADYLTDNRFIREVNLSSCAIGNRGAQRICEALVTNRALVKIDLSDNMMDIEGLSTLPAVLRKNDTLREFKLKNTRLNAAFIEQVDMACSLNRECRAVKNVYYRLKDGDASLKKIELCNPDNEHVIDDETVRTICTVLTQKTFVEVIDLSENHIGKDGCAALAATLSEPTSRVRKLILSKNPIDDYAVAELVACFPNNVTLREVILYSTDMTNTGIGMLAKGLERNNTIYWIGVLNDDAVSDEVTLLQRNLALNNSSSTLKKVILSIDSGEDVQDVDLSHPVDSSLNDELCQYLCASLLRCSKIQSLNLSNNMITSASVPYIVEVMELCPSLFFLDLSNNKIDEKGAEQIIECLERVSHVRIVQIAGNSLTTEIMERVAHLASLNSGSDALKKLFLLTARGEPLPENIDLSGTENSYKLTDEEVVALAGLLRYSSVVRSLDLGNNNFSDEGCIAIAAVLRVNHTLEELNFAGNAIGANGGEALFFALKINPQLQLLNLENTAIPGEILEDIVSLLHVNQMPHRAPIDMRGVKLEEVDDAIQFHSTDYYVSQMVTIDETIQDREEAKVQLIEQRM